MAIKIDESVLRVKEWECEVISNKNVATFIKEFIVALPKGEHMDFIPGSYARLRFLNFQWIMIRTSIRPELVMNICQHGRNSVC